MTHIHVKVVKHFISDFAASAVCFEVSLVDLYFVHKQFVVVLTLLDQQDWSLFIVLDWDQVRVVIDVRDVQVVQLLSEEYFQCVDIVSLTIILGVGLHDNVGDHVVLRVDFDFLDLTTHFNGLGPCGLESIVVDLSVFEE